MKLLDQLVEPRHVGEPATETKLMREVNCLIEGAAVPTLGSVRSAAGLMPGISS